MSEEIKRTAEEILAEVEALTELKGKVRAFSVFGDDNIAAIESQIHVLNVRKEVPFDQQFPHQSNAADDAWRWLTGSVDTLSEEWEPLVEGNG